MTRYQKFLNNTSLRRAVVLASLVIVLWLARSVMSTILLTFIFTFLVSSLVRAIQRIYPIRPAFVVVPLYAIIVTTVLYSAIHFVPAVAIQSVHLFNSVKDFYYSDAFANNQAMQWVLSSINSMNLDEQFKAGFSTVLQYVGNIGAMGVTLFLSFILSFFYTLETKALNEFGQNFLDSPFGWYFQDLKYFADKFTNTFGVVIEAQIFIAIVNTLITTVTLIVMKMPNIPSLAIMVFLLSMIPVAGAIISVVPLAVIAFTVDGWQGVLTIIVMIAVIHALEAYVLNPKFMSSRTKLPVFFTFVVLILAERLFGTWGLIVGIPVFTFLLDVFGIKKIANTD